MHHQHVPLQHCHNNHSMAHRRLTNQRQQICALRCPTWRKEESGLIREWWVRDDMNLSLQQGHQEGTQQHTTDFGSDGTGKGRAVWNKALGPQSEHYKYTYHTHWGDGEDIRLGMRQDGYGVGWNQVLGPRYTTTHIIHTRAEYYDFRRPWTDIGSTATLLCLWACSGIWYG